MREIKFRAYHKIYGRIEVTDMNWEYQRFDGLGMNNGKPCKYSMPLGDADIVEYTGLHGKNGVEIVEIYEGDIISSQCFIEQRADVKQLDTGEWIADYGDNEPVCLLKELGKFSCEVIGNIYEEVDNGSTKGTNPGGNQGKG